LVIEMTVRQVPCGAPHGYRRHRMRSSMSSLRLRFSPTCTTSLLRFWSSSRLHILLTALCVRFWALQPILACQSPLRRTGRNDTLVLGAYLFLQRSTQKVIFDLLVKYDYIVLHSSCQALWELVAIEEWPPVPSENSSSSAGYGAQTPLQK